MTLDLFKPVSETQKDRINAAMIDTPPHDPGVYTFYDKRDQVLYVGKAKDLFKRITSYRYSRSKKVQRMVAHVHRIGYEICKSETDAVLLENLLIRSLRPPFNTANKKTETYYYISTARSGNKREFRLSMRQLQDYPKCYGCFKGHVRVRKGLGALLRFLFWAHDPIQSAHYLPTQLVGRITPSRFKVQLSDETGVRVHQFLSGTSDLLISEFEDHITGYVFKDRFTMRYFENELEQLRVFFALGPERNNRIKEILELESSLIQQHDLDDLQVLLSEKESLLVNKSKAMVPGAGINIPDTKHTG